MSKRIVAADIGGTSSRFAFFRWESGSGGELLDSQWIETKRVTSFSELLDAVSAQTLPFAIAEADYAVLAAAGPVSKNGKYCKPPWIDWDIDLTKEVGALNHERALLINDFVAQAYAVQTHIGKEARVVLEGAETEATASVGVLGAGTNLGKAIVVHTSDGKVHAVPSEGGHVSFPVHDAREFEFLQFVAKKREADVVTLENVVSGQGIAFVHEFLTGEKKRPEDVTASFDTHCETHEWCARFYGRACRDFALDILAAGGLYIAGGVAAKVPELLTCAAFREEFLRSPRHRELLERIPVKLFANEESGLWGAAFCAAQQLH